MLASGFDAMGEDSAGTEDVSGATLLAAGEEDPPPQEVSPSESDASPSKNSFLSFIRNSFLRINGISSLRC